MNKIIGAGIIVIDKVSGRLLLCRRGMKGNYPNCWSFFGGTFEKTDIIPKNTAIREFLEETKCQNKFLIGKKPFYICEDNHINFYSYLGVFDIQFIPQLNSENVEFGWFDIDMMPENLHPGVKEMFENKHKEILLTIKKISLF